MLDLRTVGERRATAGWGRREAVALVAGWAGALAASPLSPLSSSTFDSGAGSAAAAWAAGAGMIFWALAVAVVRSDLRTFTIPDEASIALALFGSAEAAGAPWLAGDGGGAALSGLLDAAATGAGAFALFWAIGAAFRALGRDALGHGDVKLAGALAIWLSPGDGALALELAALCAIAALVVGRGGTALRDTAVPFGAFMAPAAWLVFVVAPPLRDAGWLPW